MLHVEGSIIGLMWSIYSRVGQTSEEGRPCQTKATNQREHRQSLREVGHDDAGNGARGAMVERWTPNVVLELSWRITTKGRQHKDKSFRHVVRASGALVIPVSKAARWSLSGSWED